MDLVERVFGLLRTNWLYILVVSIPILAYFIFADRTTIQAFEIWSSDPSGANVANYGVLRFLLFVIQVFMSAVFARLIMRVFVGKPKALWRIDQVINRSTARFFAIFMLLYLAVIGFVILIVPPFVHLAYILNMTPTMTRLLLIVCGGPLFIWASTFAIRALLMLPADANETPLPLRQVLCLTETYYWKIAIFVILGWLLFWLMSLLPIWHMPTFDIFTAFLRASIKSFGLVVMCAVLASIYLFTQTK